MIRIAAGRFDTTIQFLKEITSRDPDFNTKVVGSWSPILEIRAEVLDELDAHAEEMVGGKLTKARNQTRVRFRWNAEITSALRVKIIQPTDRQRTLEIVSGPIEVGGRKRYMQVMCEEIT